jgi:hypothetical protein
MDSSVIETKRCSRHEGGIEQQSIESSMIETKRCNRHEGGIEQQSMESSMIETKRFNPSLVSVASLGFYH